MKNEVIIVIEEPMKDTIVPPKVLNKMPDKIESGAIVKKRKENIKYSPINIKKE